jgi:fructose-1-phosphate kinase PfkB-like protein
MVFDALVINANPLLNVVHAGEFTPGIVNRVPTMTMLAEGKGVNVARFLARHGHAVALTGFAGGHSGAWLRDLITAEGVTDAFVESAAPLRVGFMASSGAADHPTTVLPDGFPVTASECRTLLKRVDDLLGFTKLVIMSGSVPDPSANGLYIELLALCERRGVKCWLDAYGPALTLALAGPVAPRVCKPNRQEFEHSKDWNRVQELHITDGGGTIEVDSRSEGRWRVLPPIIRQVNPIGSGDCYIGGLAHGWLAGFAMEDRLRYAASAGAANALRQDVAMILPAEIEPLLRDVKIRRER